MSNKNIFLYLIYAIMFILIIRWIYLYFYYKNTETFDSSFQIFDECSDMTPKKLLQLFDNDNEKLSQLFVEHNVPVDLVKNRSSYPIIASYFLSKGILKKCK